MPHCGGATHRPRVPCPARELRICRYLTSVTRISTKYSATTN